MDATRQGQGLAVYRHAVTELMSEGESFREVERAIDALDELTTDQRDALWLFAFSLRDRAEQRQARRGHLAAVQ